MDYPRLVGIGINSGTRNLSAILPAATQVLSLDYAIGFHCAIDEEWGNEVCCDLVHLVQSRLLVCPNLTTVALAIPCQYRD